MMITIQEARDMASSIRATALVTMSPWFQRWARPNSAFMLLLSLENEMDGDVEPHGFGHAAPLARNVAPLAHGFQGRVVQAVVAAGLLEVGVLGAAVSADQHAHDHLALFPE